MRKIRGSTLRRWPTVPPRGTSPEPSAAGVRSSWNRNFLEDLTHDGGYFCSLNFEFRTQHHAVFEDRLDQDTDIVRSHVIPAVQSGMCATGKEKRLSRTGSGSDQHAIMFPGLANDIDQIG